MTKLQAEVILALADNGLVKSRAAKALYRSLTGIIYHIQNIHEKTGLDPLDFWDMQKLVPMAQRTLTFHTVTENMKKVIESAEER